MQQQENDKIKKQGNIVASDAIKKSYENNVQSFFKGGVRVFGPISDSNGEQIYIINGERYKFDGQCFDGPISD